MKPNLEPTAWHYHKPHLQNQHVTPNDVASESWRSRHSLQEPVKINPIVWAMLFGAAWAALGFAKWRGWF
jgi:hypothetical protein